MPMTLSHTPEDWGGTFILVVKTAIEDILSDGAPFKATITCDGKKYAGSVLEVTRTGQVTIDYDLPGGDVATAYIKLGDIDAIEVA